MASSHCGEIGMPRAAREAGARIWNVFQAGHYSLPAGIQARSFARTSAQGWMYPAIWLPAPRTLGVPAPFVGAFIHGRRHRGETDDAAGPPVLSRDGGKIVYIVAASHQQHAELGYHDERATIIPNGFDWRFRQGGSPRGVRHTRPQFGIVSAGRNGPADEGSRQS
jgi:hypothetical protein